MVIQFELYSQQQQKVLEDTFGSNKRPLNRFLHSNANICSQGPILSSLHLFGFRKVEILFAIQSWLTVIEWGMSNKYTQHDIRKIIIQTNGNFIMKSSRDLNFL